MAALTALVPPARAGENLLRDGGFEEAGRAWALPGDGTTVDGEVAHTGARSLKLSWDKPAEPRVASQDFAAQAGRRYLVRGWMKAGEVQGAWWSNAYLQAEWAGTRGYDWNDPRQGVLGHARVEGVRGVTDWVAVSYVTPPAPAGTCRGRLSVSIDWNGFGTAWVDDLAVEPLPGGPVLQWRCGPQSVVGEADSGPFAVSVEHVETRLFPGPVDVAVALRAPTWNKVLVERREAYRPGLRVSFPTGNLNPGLWRLGVTVLDRATGRPVLEPELRDVWKRAPLEVTLEPHGAVVVAGEGAPRLTVLARRRGALRVMEGERRLLAAEVVPGERVRLRPPEGAGRHTVQCTLGTSREVVSYTVLAPEAAREGVRVSREGVLLDHGEPWLPIFMLTNTALDSGPYWDGMPEREQRNPERLAETLGRLEGTPLGLMDWATPLGGLEATVALADACQARGVRLGVCLRDLYPDELGGWAGFGRRARWFPGLDREAIARQLVRALRDHPALAFWYVNDELGPEYLDLTHQMRDWVHEEDPLHPTVASYQDFDPVGALAGGMDVVAGEYYAWRSLDEPLDMARMAEQMGRNLPPGMMTWGNLIWLAPSYAHYLERFRAGAYIALAKGARGLLIDGVHRVRDDAEWRWLGRLARELQARAPLLCQPPTANPVTCRTPGVVLADVDGPRGRCVLVVNGTREALTAELVDTGRRWRVPLRPYGVRVLRWGPEGPEAAGRETCSVPDEPRIGS